MYYKKHNEIAQLPEDLKLECIEFAKGSLEKKLPMNVWYQRVDIEDPTNLAYSEPGTEITGSGGVGFYSVPSELNNKICEFYKNAKSPIADNKYYFIQVVNGGKFVLPHIDDPVGRQPGYIYLLKNGGHNVKTTWYTVKDEFKNLNKTFNTGIPYFKLDIAEEHCLEENCWHFMNFSEIHCVKNQESLRLALWGVCEAFWE